MWSIYLGTLKTFIKNLHYDIIDSLIEVPVLVVIVVPGAEAGVWEGV